MPCQQQAKWSESDVFAAGLVAFLSGPAGAYITGQNIAVDGGYSVMGMY